MKTFEEHSSKLKMSDIRQEFIDLLGEDKIKFIENNNWVEFDRLYQTIRINFIETDGIGDDVIFFSIFYDEDEYKWFSLNCIDSEKILFVTYNELKNHIKSIERDIIRNRFKLAKL